MFSNILNADSVFPKIDIAILSAMMEELEYFEDFFKHQKVSPYLLGGLEFKIYEYNHKKILICPTGFGTTFAASIVTLIHQHFSPKFMFFSGTAGGINPNLTLRDVVIIEKAFEAEIQGAFTILKGTPFEGCLTHPIKKQTFPSLYTADENLLALASQCISKYPSVYKGTAVSSNTFPAPEELFENIKTEDPYCIDMETSALYQVAWLLNLRVLAVRGISNCLNSDGTDDKVEQSDVKGSSKAAAKVILEILETLFNEQHIAPKQALELQPA